MLRVELEKAGLPLNDEEAANHKLAELRAMYEPFLLGLGNRFLYSVPRALPGDRDGRQLANQRRGCGARWGSASWPRWGRRTITLREGARRSGSGEDRRADTECRGAPRRLSSTWFWPDYAAARGAERRSGAR